MSTILIALLCTKQVACLLVMCVAESRLVEREKVTEVTQAEVSFDIVFLVDDATAQCLLVRLPLQHLLLNSASLKWQLTGASTSIGHWCALGNDANYSQTFKALSSTNSSAGNHQLGILPFELVLAFVTISDKSQGTCPDFRINTSICSKFVISKFVEINATKACEWNWRQPMCYEDINFIYLWHVTKGQ